MPFEVYEDEACECYRVRWEIDIEADSPRQAAVKALEIQRDRNSMATVFEVNGERIDLSERKKRKDVGPPGQRQKKAAISKRKGGEKQ